MNNPLMSLEEFVLFHGIREVFHLGAIKVLRCGCGLEFCRGWQVIVPGQETVYPIPND